MTEKDRQNSDISSNSAPHDPPTDASLTEVHKTSYDPQAETPSEAVINAIAAVDNVDPTDLDPLYATIDPDALNSLFSPTPHETHEREGSIWFSLHGYHVFVHSDGQLIVHVEEKE